MNPRAKSTPVLRTSQSQASVQREKFLPKGVTRIKMSLFRRRKSTKSGRTKVSGQRRKSFNRATAEKEFDRFQDPESDGQAMGGAGLVEFCEELGIDPNGKLSLAWAWKWKCATPGIITRQEFVDGMQEMKSNNVAALKTHASTLRKGLVDPEGSTLKELHKFVFDLMRLNQETDKKTISLEMACQILVVMLSDVYSTHVSKFVEFLRHLAAKEELDNFRITSDQWTSFLEFCKAVNSTDLNTYDADNGAWPILLDEFVEWWKENR
eukprot:752435_1